MKIEKLENGKIKVVKEEKDNLLEYEQFTMDLYTSVPNIKVNDLVKIYNEFLTGGVIIETEDSDSEEQQEEIDDVHKSVSIDDIDKDLEELGEEECIQLDIKIGEFLAKYFDKEWRIQSAKVFRQYASEYMEVAFKRDGKAIKSRWYTGPKINLLSKIADEIKPSQSGMDGRPVIDFVEEAISDSKMQLFIKTSENISVIYTLITRRAFADMKKKAIFG